MRAVRVVVIVTGTLAAAFGLAVLAGGTAAVIVQAAGTDDDGYFRSGDFRLTSTGAAIVSSRLDLHSEPADADWLIERGDLGTVSLNVESARPGEAVFAGIGPSEDVEAYLGSVSHDRLEDFDESLEHLEYRHHDGAESATPPGAQTFWAAQVTTDRADTLTWQVDSGDWTVVLMNADGSSDVEIDARAGIKIDWLLPVAIGLMVVGAAFMASGTTAVVLGVRRSRRRGEPLPPEGAEAGTTPTDVEEAPAELSTSGRW